MARPKKETEDKEIVTKDSNSFFQSLLEDTANDHFAFVEGEPQVISSSSLTLDSLTKTYSGQILRLCGKGAELGKTSQAFVYAENFMKTMPKSKTLYVKAEARLSPEMQNRTGLKFVTKVADWDYNSIFIWPVNIFETIAGTLEKQLKNMHDNGEHLCIILDSLDQCILRGDYGENKDVWGGKELPKVAGIPLMTKLLFRRFALPLEAFNGFFIIISQYSAAIQIDPYSKEPPRQVAGSGGSAVNHMNSLTLTYQPRYGGDLILEKPDDKPDRIKNKTLGVYATIEIQKASGGDVSGTRIKIPIKRGRIGCAVWQEKEVVDCALAFSRLTRKGAWFYFAPEFIEEAAAEGVTLQDSFQGLTKVYEYVENNPEAFKWLYNKFKNIVA